MTGWQHTTGAKLYMQARQPIPGRTQLLSKRLEMHLPGQWPSYYSRAKGCEVWDLDDRRFVDMTFLGIGANLLGYTDDDVNEAVRLCVDNGDIWIDQRVSQS